MNIFWRTRREGKTSTVVLWAVLGVIALVIGVLIYLRLTRPPKEAGPVEVRPVAVRVLPIAAGRVEDVLTVPGRLRPHEDVRLSAEAGGRIVSVSVDEGDRVRSGDVLLELDCRLWENAAKRARIELREAAKDKERWERLKQTGAVSQSEYDRLRERSDLAETRLEEARIHLSHCRVVSPLDGFVEARFVDPGEYVNEGQPVFRIVEVARLKLSCFIPEKDVLYVREGKQTTFTVTGLPGRVFTGKVAFVSAAADVANNSFRIELDVAEPDGRLKAGMIGEVRLVRGVIEDAVVVPMSAVIPRNGEHTAFVVSEQKKAEARVVRIERFLGSDVLIDSGLRPGDRLVIEGQRSLQDGVPVEVVAAPDDAREPAKP